LRRFHVLAVLLVLLVVLPAGLLTGCSSGQSKATARDKILVYTSIYPLYDFVGKIGGDKIQLKNIVPSGGEPHEWEPTPRDIAEISKADVLIFCGAGMESWKDKVLGAIDKSKVVVVDASQNVELIEGKHDEEGHDHPGVDPHIWVDPVNAKTIVNNILAGLIKADGKNRKFYEANAAAYQKELDLLHQEYQTSLANVKNNEFLVSHDAFGYLAKRYGLQQVAVRGLSPEAEPSPADMANIIKMAREKQIKTIFFETTVSPKVSQTIAGELKAETLVLNPMDGLTAEEIAAGHGYLYTMRQNLNNLKIALGAK